MALDRALLRDRVVVQGAAGNVGAYNSHLRPVLVIVDVAILTELLQEAENHCGEYEPTAPKNRLYCAYIVARQEGKTPEEAAKDGKIHTEGAR